VLGIVKRWISEAVTFEGGTYPGLLLLHDVTERSVEKIKHSIVAEDHRAERLLPVFDPYTYEGRAARYVPDFLARLVDVGDGLVRTLLIEVSGGAKKHHSPGPVSEKADTARHLWVPAVKRHGQWGRWGFVEVGDPSARTAIAQAFAELAGAAKVTA
jgi:type III restriction enzyme